MSWRRFNVLVSGLSAESVYCYLTSRGGKPKPLRAADAPAFFASFPKALPAKAGE